MKKSIITIRVDQDVKRAFQEICVAEHTDISHKLNTFIVSTIENTNKAQWKKHLNSIIQKLGYTNVQFIDDLYVHRNVGTPQEKHYVVSSVKLSAAFEFPDFLAKYKDRELFIYIGNEVFPGELRVVII